MRPVLAMVASCVLLAACGQKTAPVAPELVRPRAPAGLAASSAADGVRLVWRRPQTYTGGRRMHDLARFVIDRAPGAGVPAGYERVGELELDDRMRFRQQRRIEWTDRGAKPGESYFYRVTAITVDGDRSMPAGPVTIRFEPKVEAGKETR